MRTKTELRKFAKDFRKTLNIDEVSDKILQIFFNTNIYKNALNIALYYPFGDELVINKILNDKTKNFFLPIINENDEMFFVKYNSDEELVKGKYGILEPQSKEKVNPEDFDMIIVPALMADKNGYRLGYGKGYYDKFFFDNDFRKTKIAFVPDGLFIAELPVDNNDIPMDAIITEKGIFNIK